MTQTQPRERPLEGKLAVVTGAFRGTLISPVRGPAPVPPPVLAKGHPF